MKRFVLRIVIQKVSEGLFKIADDRVQQGYLASMSQTTKLFTGATVWLIRGV